jgi:hypothetical protein
MQNFGGKRSFGGMGRIPSRWILGGREVDGVGSESCHWQAFGIGGGETCVKGKGKGIPAFTNTIKMCPLLN